MELGRARLTPAERQRRFHLGLCFYCDKEGHPQASRGVLVSHTPLTSTPSRSKRIQVQGMLRWSHDTLPVQVLIDSGADDSFIDYELVSQANIPTIALSEPQEVLALDGKQLARVTHRTEPISLTLSGNHHELIELFVISSPMSPVIVGLPWLKIHNPLVDWSTASIVNWSVFCHANCLRSAIPTSVSPLRAPRRRLIYQLSPVSIMTSSRYSVRTRHSHYHHIDLMIVLLIYFLALLYLLKSSITSPSQRKKPWRHTSRHDDILIFSKSVKEHVLHVRTVLQGLMERNL